MFAGALYPEQLHYENNAEFQKQFKGSRVKSLSVPTRNLRIDSLGDWIGDSVEQKNDSIDFKWKHITLPVRLELSAMDLGVFPPEVFEEVKAEAPELLKTLFPDRHMKIISLAEKKVGNLNGFVHDMATASGPPLRVLMWDASRKGYNYIVKLSFETADAAAVQKAYEEFFAGMMFPDAAAESPRFVSERLNKVITSSEYGYEIDPRGTYFAIVPLSGESPTKAEHALELGQRHALFYIPFKMKYSRMAPEKLLKAVISAIEGLKDIRLDGIRTETVDGKKLTRAAGKGIGKTAGSVHEFRLYSREGTYVLEIASMREFANAPHRKSVRLPFRFIKPLEGNVTYNEDQRRRHFHFLMKIGNALASEAQYAQARELYEEALALHFDDNSAVLQICSSYDKMKNFTAGYNVTEQYTQLVEANPNLMSYKAYFAYQLKNFKQAADLYERAFANGYWAYDEFEFMLKSLAESKQMDRADSLIKSYLAKQKNEELLRFVLSFYRENRELDKALAVVADAEKKFGFTERVGFEYAKVYYDQGNYSAGLGICDRMDAQGFTDPIITYNRGLFLYSMKQYPKALEVFRKYVSGGGAEESARTYIKNIEDITERTPAVYVSKDFAYNLKLDGTGFRHWDSFKSEINTAEFALLNEDFGGMAIFSLQKVLFKPAAPAGLDLLTLIHPDHAVAAGKPVKESRENGIAIQDYTYLRKSEKTRFFYFVRLVDRKHYRHAIMVWYADGDKLNSERAKIFSIVDNLNYDEDKSPAALSADAAVIQGNFLGKWGEIQSKRAEQAFAKVNLGKAHSLRPDDLGILHSLLMLHSAAQEYGRILELVLAQEKKSPGDQNLQTWKGFALYKTGKLLEAEAVYARVFATDYWHEGDFKDYLDVLSRLRKDHEVDKHLKAALANRYSADLALFAANYERNRRQFDTARALYDRLISENPNNTDARIEKGWLHIYEENFKSALDICDELLRQNIRTASVEYLKGVALYKLGRYREAKPSFEYVVRLSPKDANARDYLNHVTSLLGQGQNSDIQQPIAAVEIPGGYVSDNRPSGISGEASVINRSVKAVYFAPDRPERTTHYYDFTIEKEAGIASHSKYSFGFDPLRERIFVNKLLVTNRAGQKIQGKAEEYYVVDELDDSNVATGKKELRIIVPGLEPGSRGEIQVTTESLQPAKRLQFVQSLLAHSIATRKSEVYLCGEHKTVKSWQIHASPPEDTGDCKKWHAENPVILARENLRPNSAAFAPIVYFGSSDESWSRLARDYATKIRDRLADAASVKSQADALVAGLKDDAEKIRKITEFVQSSIKYEAIEFGTRGIIPNNAAKTLQDKFGDCKDQALLVRQLLKSQGIPAELALIHTYAAFVESIPSLDQFNHMIVYLPSYKGGKFFDPTQKDLGLADLAPIDLEGQTALLVSEENSQPRRITRSGEPKSAITIDRLVRTRPGKLTVREKVQWTSYHASFIRRYLKKHSGKPAKEVVQELIGNDFHGVSISNAVIGGVDSLTLPVTLELEYEIARTVQGDDQQFIRLPNHWEKQYVGFPAVEKRRTPFGFEYPVKMLSRSTLEVSADHTAQLSGKQYTAQTPYFLFEARSKNTKNVLVSEVTFETEFGLHPAKKYKDFKAESDKAYAAIPENVILKRKKAVRN